MPHNNSSCFCLYSTYRPVRRNRWSVCARFPAGTDWSGKNAPVLGFHPPAKDHEAHGVEVSQLPQTGDLGGCQSISQHPIVGIPAFFFSQVIPQTLFHTSSGSHCGFTWVATRETHAEVGGKIKEHQSAFPLLSRRWGAMKKKPENLVEIFAAS